MNKNYVYYEIKSYLDFLGDDYIKKIPHNVYNNIVSMSNNYIREAERSNVKPRKINNFSRELSKTARAVIFNIDYSYFSENNEEKKMLLEFIKQNEINNQKKYINNIFENNSLSEKEKLDNETLNVMYERTRLVEKFLNN